MAANYPERPEAVVFYAARIQEVVIDGAVERVDPPLVRAEAIAKIGVLHDLGALHRVAYTSASALRRLGNHARHVHRPFYGVDASLAVAFLEQVLAWYDATGPWGRDAGPGFVQLPLRGASLHRVRDELRQALEAEADGSWLSAATSLASPETPVGEGLVAEVLIEANRPAEAFELARRALQKHAGDWRLRQMAALAASRRNGDGDQETALAILGEGDGPFYWNTETRGIRAAIHKRRWRNSGLQDSTALRAALECYRSPRLHDRGGAGAINTWTEINVALLTGFAEGPAAMREVAGPLAHEISRRADVVRALNQSPECTKPVSLPYWTRATLAEATLLKGDLDSALELYRRAFESVRYEAGSVTSTLDQLDLVMRLLPPADQARISEFTGPVDRALGRQRRPDAAGRGGPSS